AADRTGGAFTANPETDIIAKNSTRGSSHNHEWYNEVTCRASINGSNKKHRFTRKGNTDTFNTNKYQHCPVAVSSEQMQKVGCGDLEHRVGALSFSKNCWKPLPVKFLYFQYSLYE